MPQPDKMKRRLAALTPRDLEHLSRFYGQVSDGPQASAVEAAPHQGAAAACDSGGQ